MKKFQPSTEDRNTFATELVSDDFNAPEYDAYMNPVVDELMSEHGTLVTVRFNAPGLTHNQVIHALKDHSFNALIIMSARVTTSSKVRSLVTYQPKRRKR